ncbi:hypothetical protein H0H81_007093 [Sphagnurus paluster]|uniref:Enoyl reductase (ER) domain-containing protein n=1 Tax=Sphagnurus paluster TaxID=117069 RepID=A0A9P7GNQ1_9AGAR|nr:hypothetical protein H0H81_007093 [Sphagnurus paluster]
MNILMIGGSRNVGYYASLRFLGAHFHFHPTVTFLLRNLAVFDEEKNIQECVKSKKAFLVKGDAMIQEDVKRAWDTAAKAVPSGNIDLLVITVGGILKFNFPKGFTITPPNLVTCTVLNALCTLPTPSPRIIFITSAGISRSARAALPLPLKPIYTYVLPAPHRDKIGAERVAAHVAGWSWDDKEDGAPVAEILDAEGAWRTREGLPGPGSLKDSILIIRPAMFTDGECVAEKEPRGKEGKKPYRISEGEVGGWTVSRKDVAYFLVDAALNRWDEFKGKRNRPSLSIERLVRDLLNLKEIPGTRFKRVGQPALWRADPTLLTPTKTTSILTMRGFLVSELKHHSEISLSTNVPEPKAGPGQVLVDVYSAGLNFFDILQTQGKYQNKPPLPFVLGTEFAGRISKDSPILAGCPYKPGDRVFGAGQGTYADKVAVDLERVLPLPDAISYDQGAGEWVLVTAAAGGVGIAAVQLAKGTLLYSHHPSFPAAYISTLVLGAKVIAAAGSETKLDIAKRYGGADYGINYSNPGWQKEVLNLTGGKGVDVIYDPVGLINDALKCIAWKGRALVIGFAAGTIEKVPMNLVLLKNISLVGLHWGAYSKFEQDRIPVVWKALLELFASGKAKPVTYSQIYSLEKLSEGLAALERRETWGKAIARVRDENTAKL